MKKNNPYLSGWVWKMAFRDSRSHRRKLLLFMSSIILGTAALVAISSLGDNLERAIEEQSKTLLAADLMIRGQQPFSEETEALFDSIGGDQSQQINFSSMILVPKTQATRLVAVRSLKGEFPYYGAFVTEPDSARQTFRTKQSALVDDGLMIQFGIEVGDSIKLGDLMFRVEGRLKKIPGEAVAAAMIGPRVYIPMQYLEATELIRPGSLASYRRYFKLAPQTDVKKLVEQIRPRLESNRLRWRTVESVRENVGEAMTNLYNFLNLVGFIALLLGCIGVASAIHVYIKQKLSTIAFLHCVGAQTRQTFAIYLIQAFAMGLFGAAIGTALGVSLQNLLPAVLSDFLPIDLELTISISAILRGLFLGLSLALLFALLPLLTVREVSPLMVLRASFEPQKTKFWQPQRLILILVLIGAVTIFAISQTDSLDQALGFVGGVGAVFLLLTLIAKLFMFIVKRYLPNRSNYLFRQSMANLHRPNNQTITMMVALGLGTFLITTLFLTQRVLLNEVSLSSTGTQPNLVFFDIQTDQVEGVEAIVESHEKSILQNVPIVTMRLASIKGRAVEEIMADTARTIPRWALRREYRSTYRDSLTGTETLIAGQFIGTADDPSDSIWVSLEQDIAEDLEVGLGDALVFDVQGVPITTYIGSLRTVDWRRVQPNFFVVFPTGILEQAPQFHVVVLRVDSAEESAVLQREVVNEYANVSAIDLSLILDTVDNILDKISFVIRFMALFSIFTGLTVLVGAVISSRYQRMQESVLLRTIGASQRQIRTILILEYCFLGSLASLTGLLLSIIGSWALSFFVFEAAYFLPDASILMVVLIVTAITVALGILNSRGITTRPPLEILRSEV